MLPFNLRYLTTFLHNDFISFTVNILPRKPCNKEMNASTSSEVPALGCSGYPIISLSLLRYSMLSMLVVTAITVSLENPQIPLIGLENKLVLL